MNKVSPSYLRATAEGMVKSGSTVHRQVPILETGEKDLWIYGASCARTSAVFICWRFLKPKGRNGKTEVSPQDKQDFGIWALSKRQGGSMYTSRSTPNEKSVWLQEENQLIVLQYEHLWRPQAKIRESIE